MQRQDVESVLCASSIKLDAMLTLVGSCLGGHKISNKCTLGDTPLLSGNFVTHLDDFGLENYGAIVGTFIHEANLITNASFSEVKATADSNIELQ
nr:hypothetical protein CFP56_33342 [Quercus suber]